jgi:hypothetical protein
MPLLIRASRQSIEIRSVAHNMINFGKHLRDLRRDPAIGSGPKTHDEEPWTIDSIG